MAETKSTKTDDSSKSDTLSVTLTNDAEAAVFDVRSHATALGALSTSGKGRKLTVELPVESVRNPSDKRQRLIDGLSADPNVASVE